jgi:hypothetical protein
VPSMYQRERCQRFRKKIAQKVFGGLLINESSRLAHMMNRVRVHPPFVVLMMVSAFLFLTATLGRTIEQTDREVKAQEAAVLAGGCFWDVDAVFKHVKGVSKSFLAIPEATLRRRSMSSSVPGQPGTLSQWKSFMPRP